MKNEIVDEKAAISGIEAELEKTATLLNQVREQRDTARRREEMARGIEDDETVKVAAEYATRQESHLQVLEKKEAALKEELEFRRRTLDGMYQQFDEAKEKREALTATSGRSGARETISAADDLFGELDRMAEKIEGERARGEVAEAFSDADLGLDNESEYHIDVEEPSRREELDVDAALEELKRRMGED